MSATEPVDVIVVGAGVSGLTAAFELQKLNKTFVVVEANNRIGGRTWSRYVQCASGQQRWDVGGQWVGNTQPHVLQLLDELGIRKYRQYTAGKQIDVSKTGEVTKFEGELDGPGSITGGLDGLNLLRKIENSAKKVPPTSPFADSDAEKWNKQTVKDYADKHGWTKEGKELLEVAVSGPMDVDSTNVSALFVMMYLNSAGSNVEVFTSEKGDGAQGFRIENGAQSISETLASKLPPNSINLQWPVTKIEQSSNPQQVVVTSSNGHTLNAAKVILAIPPVLAAQIQYTPLLSAAKQKLLAGLAPKANSLKVISTYDQPFWRQAGFSGQATIQDVTNPRLPELLTVDGGTSRDGGHALIGFAEFPVAYGVPSTLAERKQAYIEQLVKAFGQEAAYPIELIDQKWSDEPWALGCVSSAVPGVLSPQYPNLIKDPVGNIHWAGTETATVWMGYINGAVQAGIRAARECANVKFEDKNDSMQRHGGSNTAALKTLSISSILISLVVSCVLMFCAM